MPFIVCPQSRTRNRIPVAKEGLHGKCGRCGQPLPSFNLKHPTELDDTIFASFLQPFGDLLRLLDFYSSAPEPCPMLSPTIATLPQKFKGHLAFGKLNTDHNPQTAHGYQINGVSTLIYIRNGQAIDQSVGPLPEYTLLQRVKNLL